MRRPLPQPHIPRRRQLLTLGYFHIHCGAWAGRGRARGSCRRTRRHAALPGGAASLSSTKNVCVIVSPIFSPEWSCSAIHRATPAGNSTSMFLSFEVLVVGQSPIFAILA